MLYMSLNAPSWEMYQWSTTSTFSRPHPVRSSP